MRIKVTVGQFFHSFYCVQRESCVDHGNNYGPVYNGQSVDLYRTYRTVPVTIRCDKQEMYIKYVCASRA